MYGIDNSRSVHIRKIYLDPMFLRFQGPVERKSCLSLSKRTGSKDSGRKGADELNIKKVKSTSTSNISPALNKEQLSLCIRSLCMAQYWKPQVPIKCEMFKNLLDQYHISDHYTKYELLMFENISVSKKGVNPGRELWGMVLLYEACVLFKPPLLTSKRELGLGSNQTHQTV